MVSQIFRTLLCKSSCDDVHIIGHDLDLYSEDEERVESLPWDKGKYVVDKEQDSGASSSPKTSRVDILLGSGMRSSNSPCLTPPIAGFNGSSYAIPPVFSQPAVEDSMTGIPCLLKSIRNT